MCCAMTSQAARISNEQVLYMTDSAAVGLPSLPMNAACIAAAESFQPGLIMI